MKLPAGICKAMRRQDLINIHAMQLYNH